MKTLLIGLLAVASLSAFAASEKGRVYVNSFKISEGQTIVISGKAAKLLFDEVTANHESAGIVSKILVKQSPAMVCIKDNRNYECTIRIDPKTGETINQPLHHVNF